MPLKRSGRGDLLAGGEGGVNAGGVWCGAAALVVVVLKFAFAFLNIDFSTFLITSHGHMGRVKSRNARSF